MGRKGGRRGKGGSRGHAKKSAGAKGKTSKKQQPEAEAYDVYDEGEVDFSKVKPVDGDDSDLEYALDSDNDEDIDSDAAFDEEDEKVFQDLANQGKMKAKKPKGQTSSKPSHPTLDLLDEDEGDAEEKGGEDNDDDANGDVDDLMDLSEMLARGEADEDRAVKHESVASVSEELFDDDDDAAGKDKGEQESKEEEEEEEEERYNKVMEGFHNMSRRLVDRKERTEAEAPSMMNVVGTASTDKVSMSDLLGALGKESKKVTTLKKKLAPLQAQEKKMRLDTPLGTATKSKIARQAAFEHAADNASRWEPVVRENRRAQHLSFVEEPASKTLMSTVAALASKFKPKKGIEEEIAKALKESKAEEKRNSALTEAESLALKALSPREAEERVRELAGVKALNSYYEAKCRRMKKIKSRKYRKIRRKAQRHLDGESLDELDEEDRRDRLLKQERQRAQERLTLKHRGKGKWAKRMLSRGNIDADTRRALNEQQRLAGDLLQKTTGGDDADADEDEDEDDGGSDFDESKETVEEAVQKLEKDLQKKPQVDSGIEGMKFMQQAVEQQREEAQQMLRELKAELDGGPGVDGEEASHRFTMAPATAGSASKTSKAQEEESKRKRDRKRKPGVDTHDDYDDNNDDSTRAGDDSDAEGGETNVPKKQKSKGKGGDGPKDDADDGDGDDDATPRFRGKRRVRASGAVEVGVNGDGSVAMEVTSMDISEQNDDDNDDADDAERGEKERAKRGKAAQQQTKASKTGTAKQQEEAGAQVSMKKGLKQSTQTEEGAHQSKGAKCISRSRAQEMKADEAGEKATPASKEAKSSKDAAPVENAYLAALFGKGGSKAKGKKNKEEGEEAEQGDDAATQGSNPWLTAVSSNAGLTPELVITSKSTKGEKQLAKAQALRKKAHKGSAPQLTELEAKVAAGDQPAPIRKKGAGQDLVLDEEEAAQDATEGHNRLDLSKANHANKKLIQQAFAADDVLVKEFEREKTEIAEEETAKDKVTLMPGWGDWAGHGISNARRPVKRIVKKAPKQRKRRDAALKKVIISEKQDKKLNKRRLADIPHPFENPQHFEKTMQTPVGREWNTDVVFRSSVRPAVETQAGAVIEPMKMTKGATSEAKRRFEAKTGEDLTPKRLQGDKKPRGGKGGRNNKKRRKHGKKQAAK